MTPLYTRAPEKKARDTVPGAAEKLVAGLLYFMVYALLGWAAECCYTGFHTGRWVNKGFLWGPFSPLYGAGMILLTLIPFQRLYQDSFKGKVLPAWIALLLTSGMIFALLEYLTGWGLERYCRIRWLDYSQRKGNLCGRIWLPRTVCIGVLGFLLAKALHPFLAARIMQFPFRQRLACAAISAGYLILDNWASYEGVLSFCAVMRDMESRGESFGRELQALQKAQERELLDYQSKQQEFRRDWRQKIEEAKTPVFREEAQDGDTQKKIEQANEELRLMIRESKEVMAKAANARTEEILAYQETYSRGIREVLGEMRSTGKSRRFFRLCKAFPDLMPGKGWDALSQGAATVVPFLWSEVKAVVNGNADT